ncbi:AFR691Wp [Eremothecium gossypii ATCC 10895]|uniref:AFR691Wp n=1 Tax=Eremothecium gossypii (strain ATCC 10895 / CBS 109.51 / FGSC 9923 / NRRL Y-1056) TaxID=284811 RepID=Q751Y4_EREGS|nr:AFR691Wp [Eremothecium gossypii ATCC 10895]AAS54063.1 AFR691Wp [Eremothecium gossypii ATCC 10895]AEY98378.1 FAFR691Wp [Eremothecium gossypii FDAG1]
MGQLRPVNLERLQAWCRELEESAPAVAYYMKLYTVERILSQGDGARRDVAAALLDEVERFKEAAQGANGDEGMATVVRDQTAAKALVLHFALHAHNSVLERLSAGDSGRAVARALWCCVDLLEAVVHLWGGRELMAEEQRECERRVKRAKWALARGTARPAGAARDEEDARDAGDAVASAGDAGESVGDAAEKAAAAAAPPAPQPPSVREPSPPHATAPDYEALLNREQQLEQANKHARYAISAINYEDLTTARRELAAALATLENM